MILSGYIKKRGLLIASPRFCFLLLLFILPVSGAYAKLEYTENCRLALHDVLNLKYASAKAILNNERKVNPDNSFILFIENYIDFLELTLSEDQAQFKYRRDNFEKRIKTIGQEKANESLKTWILGEMHFQHAVTRLRFGEYLNGSRSARLAYNILEENKKKYPGSKYGMKYLGLMQIVLASVPSEYKWLLSILGVEGDQDKGFSELRKIAKGDISDPFVREAKMILLFALMNFQDPSAVKDEAKQLITEVNDDSPLSVFFSASALFKLEGNEEALARLIETSSINLVYLEYMKGVAYLQKLDIRNAQESFQSFLDKTKGKDYQRAALQKLAWCRLLDNDHSGYFQYMSLIKREGVSTLDEDKMAGREAERGVKPAVQLLKARLLTDGGYYKEAKDILLRSSSVIVEPWQETEYSYRFARLYHKLGNVEKAKGYYRVTIRSDLNNETYYPVASALQLGILFEAEGNRSEAEKYFNYCLSNDPPDYKASLHQKAKAGLKRMK